MTSTPLHLITGGDWPSGEAIGRAEAPLVNKANKQIAKFKPSLVEIAHRSTEIANTRINLGLNEDAPIDAIFENTEVRDPLQLAQTIATLAPFVSRLECQRLAGYTKEESANIETEREDEQKQQQDNIQAFMDANAADVNAQRNDTAGMAGAGNGNSVTAKAQAA
jgi:hypothetical protein